MTFNQLLRQKIKEDSSYEPQYTQMLVNGRLETIEFEPVVPDLSAMSGIERKTLAFMLRKQKNDFHLAAVRRGKTP